MTPTEIIGLNVVSLLIGYFIGNRLVIDRDRRREFNALVGPVRIFLLKQMFPTDIDFTLIREKLPRWKRRGFDLAVERYKKSKGPDNQKENNFGEVLYDDTSLIIHTTNDLLKFLKLK